MHPLWWLSIDLLSSATGLSIPYCCPSMIYEVFLCDDYHPLFPVVLSSAAYHDDRHGWTMIACGTWWLTVNAPNVWRGHWPVAIIRLFYAFCMTCQSFCSICFQRPGFVQVYSLVRIPKWVTGDWVKIRGVFEQPDHHCDDNLVLLDR